ncbi:hypothetical protein M0804_002384 [Polistes exclamans]|nr:hypothetical protein M0804_002384 [Polistes exclamans]
MDEPHFKATFTITIGHYSNQTVTSNTNVKKIEQIDNFYRLTTFSTTPRMSTYLVGWSVHDYVVEFSKFSKDFKIWTRDSMRSHGSLALNQGWLIYSALRDWMKVENPIKKMDQFAITDFNFNAMENWGMITYRESVVLFQNETIPMRNIVNGLTTMAHEYAHTWFGNLVTPEFWDVAWLKEGFASYFQYFGPSLVQPTWKMMDMFVVDYVQPTLLLDSMNHDRSMNGRNVGSPNSIMAMLDFVTYRKGASVIRMLNHAIGEDVFQKGLHYYLEEMLYRAARPNNLYHYLQRSIDTSSNETNNCQSIKDVFESWANQVGYPLIMVKRNYTRHWTLVSQEKFYLNRDKEKKIKDGDNDEKLGAWWIPLTFATSSSIIDFQRTRAKLWLTPRNKSLMIPKFRDDEWVLFNVQQIGFYRVNYDESNWKMLIDHLRSKEFISVPSVNRAALLDDAFNLARSGYINYSIPFDLSKYLKRETDYEPWIAAINNFMFLNRILNKISTVHKAFQKYAENLILPIYELLGFKEDLYCSNVRTKLQREIILSAACALNNAHCLDTSKMLFNSWISESNKTISANLKSFVYCIGIRNGNDDDWFTMWNKFLETDLHIEQELLLSALGCTRNPILLNKYLNVSISPSSKIRKQYRFSIVTAVTKGNPENVDHTLEFVENNFESIIDSRGYDFLGKIFNTIGESMTTMEQTNKLNHFVEQNGNRLGSALKAAKKAIDSASENAKWVEKYKETLSSAIMALLKVLMSLALLVVITSAEYPSQHSNILRNNKVINEKKTIVDKSRYSEYDVAPPDYRLPENIVPKHYDISLNLDFNKFGIPDYKYDGKVTINLEVKGKTKDIRLHFTNSISLTKTELHKDSKDLTKIEITGVQSVDGTDIKILTLKDEIDDKSTYTLILEYNGMISNLAKGFYKGSYLDEDLNEWWYVMTDFEPIGARNAFPCFDEPHLKATFSIRIKYNKGYKAISNMGEKSTKIEGDFEEKEFNKTPLMSTYLVAYAVTKFSEYEENNVIVYSRLVESNMTKSAATIGYKVLEFMNKYTGINYSMENLRKMQQIALPALKPTAMENWGLVTYRETALLYDKNLNKTIDEQRLASIISHELAHQWFGNLVTLKWWKHIWLNEGFATYFQYLITDEIDKQWHFMDQFNVKCLQNALAYDAEKFKSRALDNDASSEKEISNMFDTISYDKGASVIRMFSHVLKKDNFQKGLQKYLTDNKFGAVTSENLFLALSAVVNKTDLPENTDLTTVFKTWTNQAGYPVITVTVNRKDKNPSITVKQEPFYSVKGTDANKNSWYIPLNYVQQKENSSFSDTSVKLWLLPNKEITIDNNVDAEGWIIFNVQQTGYYRVNYDSESWNIIAEYLLHGDLNTIHPLNRAQLVDDAFNLAHAGLLNYSVTLNLVKYLEKETDYIVWKAALNGLSTMNKQLGLTELYKEFLSYLNPIVHQLYNITSIHENENDDYLTKLLRVDAIKWACAFGLSECQSQAVEQVHLSFDPNNNVTLSPDLKKVTLCAAVRSATKDEWEGLFIKGLTESMRNDERTEMFTSLGCSSSPEILKSFLHKFLYIEPIKMYFIDTFEAIYSNNPVGVKAILQFLDKHLKQLKASNHQFEKNLWDYLYEFAGRIVVKEDVHLLHNVTLASGLKDTDKILDIADRNMKWFEQYGDSIKNYLITNNHPVKPETTTAKPNSSSSLTFTTALITISLLLAALQ